MARKWSEIRKTLSPEAEERIRDKVEAAAKVMARYQAREARRQMQRNPANVLEIDQGESAATGNSQKSSN